MLTYFFAIIFAGWVASVERRLLICAGKVSGLAVPPHSPLQDLAGDGGRIIPVLRIIERGNPLGEDVAEVIDDLAGIDRPALFGGEFVERKDEVREHMRPAGDR